MRRLSARLNALGVTLLELMIAVVISSFVILGLMRIFGAATDGYHAQEALADLQQNAQYSVRVLTEVLMEAGAYLPASDTTIAVTDSTRFTIRTNPREGVQVYTAAVASTTQPPVDDGSKFLGSDSVIVWRSNGTPSVRVALNKADTTGGFVLGVNTTGSPNRVKLTTAVVLAPGDKLYAFKRSSYLLNGANLCINDTTGVIAEDIKSIKVVFYDATGSIPTTTWASMRFARVYVTARSSRPDPHTHQYKEITLSGSARLRNKI